MFYRCTTGVFTVVPQVCQTHITGVPQVFHRCVTSVSGVPNMYHWCFYRCVTGVQMRRLTSEPLGSIGSWQALTRITCEAYGSFLTCR